ncbi:AAA family ATPase [Dactylosporangium vinaceum]|uniref:AAA family ATPase n=1 Tax=Dactylosporangium vinaceum TaxID=53362 RepID=A0ABV5M6R0_9ACTN|nr:AAA family ATPase [Dactylosporangium vinaceum]UAB97905.1 AAA family ATPase [Dactylosporangium vinaceum]
MTATLTITRGLPASGKTTWAKEQPHLTRVNRDDLRRMMHGGRVADEQQRGRAEREVTVAHHAAVEALLRAGASVVCDDTNLRSRVVREFAEIAARCGAHFTVRDFTDVPVEECIRRDAQRTGDGHVGEEAIRSMHQRYLAGRALPLPLPVIEETTGVNYEPPPDAPRTVLVDIDGTVALFNGRSPYDMSRVGEDRPNEPVIAAVRAMHAAGHEIVFCSGRSDDSREATEAWLAEHVGVPYRALFMRQFGDVRRDSVVKAEIFEKEIRSRYHVIGVFDDRQQVVRMWRALGLTVFQVAEGDF